MVKGAPPMIFLSSLNQKGSGGNGSKAREVSPCHRVQLLAIRPYGLMMAPVSCSEHPQGCFFPLHIQKGKRESDHWEAQEQVCLSNSLLRLC